MNTDRPMRKFLHSVTSLCGHGIHLFYERYVLPHSQDEDKKRQEFVLTVLLLLIIPFLLILDITVLVASIREGARYQGFPLFVLSSIFLVFIWLFVLTRNGYYRLASWIMLSILFVATTYGAIHWGVELPMVAISYVMIIVISSILISTRFGFIITGVIAITIITICELQIKGVIIPSLAWKHARVYINDPIELTIAFLFITGTSWLSNREIETSLRRARTSESLLRKERDQLEIIVEERTREITEMQKEKIARLYRFAEFGRLSSGVFHDLMNSLQNVTIHVDRIPTNPAALPETQEYLEKAMLASKRMATYIQNVRKQLSFEDINRTFSLREEIENVIDILKFKARTSNVALIFKNTVDPLTYGNALRFYQIMTNLIINAIEACENNTLPGKIISTLSQNKDDHCRITVEDNGYGIPLDVQRNIFNPFFTTKPHQNGIGLGLSHTKEYIEKDFNGTVTVSSNKNRTVFTITIPLNTTPHDS